MKISVFDLIGENCITFDDGQKIYGLIYPELSGGNAVDLDFKDVKIFATPFLNLAFGRLLKDIKPDDLNRLLKITNMLPTGLAALRRVIENSKEYYSNPNVRKAVDEILLEQSEAA
ncbi:MAG: STAS-like domain-containing protein [Nitrospinae bacterium]|nr:STAS-like domain-containing protein [Nitrospinota bacterium]